MMSSYESRFMRLFVFFDLPTSSKKERSQATKFRNMLLKNGFMMMQYSVYVRVCKGQDVVNKYLGIVAKHLPSRGHIRAMQVTDKQYERMEILIGEESIEEKKVGVQQLLLF